MPGNNSDVVRRVMKSRLVTTALPELSIENSEKNVQSTVIIS